MKFLKTTLLLSGLLITTISFAAPQGLTEYIVTIRNFYNFQTPMNLVKFFPPVITEYCRLPPATVAQNEIKSFIYGGQNCQPANAQRTTNLHSTGVPATVTYTLPAAQPLTCKLNYSYIYSNNVGTCTASVTTESDSNMAKCAATAVTDTKNNVCRVTLTFYPK